MKTDKQLGPKLLALGTSTVSDALDSFGIHGQCLGLKRRSGIGLAGRAYTIQYEPVGENGGTVGDYIDAVEPGQVVVLANAGRKDVTVWGDILTQVAVVRGIGGTVIDGAARDLEGIGEESYPLFSAASHMRTGKDRVYATGYNSAVVVGGVRVSANDFVIGDRDGVVVIPSAMLQEVFDKATVIASREDRIRDMVRNGSSLIEARELIGYHTLQRAESR